jgi:hypothetical protein
MHSGVVFWGEKAELRQMMAALEQADAQVQMFEREIGEWILHVNFAGAQVSRLVLESREICAILNRQQAVVAAARALDEYRRDPIVCVFDQRLYELLVALGREVRALDSDGGEH